MTGDVDIVTLLITAGVCVNTRDSVRHTCISLL